MWGNAAELRNLRVQGEEYTSACVPQNKTSLKRQLTEDAWRLVETLLCEKKSTNSKAYLATHIGKTIKYALTETGSTNQTRKTAVNAALIDSLLSEGAAWDAELTIGKTEIILKFMPNEACVRSRTLQLSKNIWKITGLGEACD
jgi:hypothetical protein